MFLRTLFNFFLMNLAYTQIIEVSSFKTHFNLNLSNPEKISIKGRQVSLSMHKDKCNKKIIQNFVRKTKTLIKAKPLKTQKEDGLFKISIDNKDFYENPKSKIGFNFLSIPREFQRMKIQEKMLCNK